MTKVTPARRRLAKLIVASTLGLIYAGGMVTSTGSALAVPDWPLAYGMLFPPMVGGVFYEHGHRLIAAAVGILTLLFAVWNGAREDRRWVRFLGFAALAGVIVQGLLGGATVLLRLPTVVSVSHAVIAHAFFCLTIVLAYALSLERDTRIAEPSASAPAGLVRASLLMGSAVFLQLVLGALLRHLGAGLAVYDFPTMAGSWLPSLGPSTLAKLNDYHLANDYPPVTEGMVLLHLLHRFAAVIIVAVSVVMTIRARRAATKVRSVSFLVLAVTVVQTLLGAFSVWTGRNPVIASLHVVTGAAALGLCVLLALRVLPPELQSRVTAQTAAER